MSHFELSLQRKHHLKGFQAINESTKGTLNPTDSIKETEHDNKHTPAINPFNRCLCVAGVLMINLSSTACNLFTVWWQSLSGTHVNTQVEQFDNLLHPPRHCTCQVSNCLLFRLLLSSSPPHLWPTPTTHSATLSHSSLNVHGVMMKKYCPHVSESVKFDVIVCVFAAVEHGTAEYCGLSWPCPVSTVWSWSIQRSQLAPAELYTEQLHSDTPES